jgi:hypothetical protein
VPFLALFEEEEKHNIFYNNENPIFYAVWQAHFVAAWGLQALNQLLEAWLHACLLQYI